MTALRLPRLSNGETADFIVVLDDISAVSNVYSSVGMYSFDLYLVGGQTVKCAVPDQPGFDVRVEELRNFVLAKLEVVLPEGFEDLFDRQHLPARNRRWVSRMTDPNVFRLFAETCVRCFEISDRLRATETPSKNLLKAELNQAVADGVIDQDSLTEIFRKLGGSSGVLRHWILQGQPTNEAEYLQSAEDEYED